MTTKIQHVPESARWYDKDGKVVLNVLAKNGMSRNPTLRDARKHIYFPSYSNISYIMAKKSIENWIIQEILEMAWKTTPEEGESEENWIEKVSLLSQEERAIPRERGTEIHASLNQAAAEEPYAHHDPIIDIAVKQVNGWFESQGVEEIQSEVPFTNVEQGYSGTADRVAILKNGGTILCDIKTTEKPPKTAWPDWARQLAAYKAGLQLPPDTSCYNLVISQVTGDLSVYPWEHFRIAEALEVFFAMRDLWFKVKKYDPRIL